MPLLNENPTCQHRHPDADTGICPDCDEQMIGIAYEADTIVSAPNAAPCRDPEHLAAMREGREFECHHPYVPDMSRATTVTVGYHVTFTCRRCEQGGTVIRSDVDGIMWDCGRDHRAYKAVR